jgi:hypothetical protein
MTHPDAPISPSRIARKIADLYAPTPDDARAELESLDHDYLDRMLDDARDELDDDELTTMNNYPDETIDALEYIIRDRARQLP